MFVSKYRRDMLEINYIASTRYHDNEPSPEETLSHKELVKKYNIALNSLNEKQRTVFLMSRIEGLKYREIAERLNLSEKAVEKRMSAALQFLKENILFPKEIEDIIFNTRPQWSRPKEDMWMEMEAKLDANPVENKIQSTRYLQLLKYAAAAVVALLISFGVAASLYNKSVETEIVKKSFLLPDNSKVVLHANSSLSYKPLLWKLSRSTILYGEAYFEVEKGSKFEVVSEKAKTVVLGTRFLVKARENEYQVHCEQGKVMLVESARKNEVVITAGQKARLKTDKQFEIIPQQQNKHTEVISKPDIAVDEKEMNISEEKPIITPKDDVKEKMAKDG